MDPPGSTGSVDQITSDRDRHGAHVADVNAGSRQPRVDRPLQHTWRVVLFTIDQDSRALRQDTTIGCAELRTKLGGDIDVNQAGDTVAAKERAPPLRAPDQTGV